MPSINCRPCQHLQSECCVFWGIQLCIHICNIWLALHGFRKKKNWTFFRVILLFVCLWCCDVCWCSLQQIIRINFHMTRVVLVEWRSMNNSWYTALMERVEPSWTSKQQLTQSWGLQMPLHMYHVKLRYQKHFYSLLSCSLSRSNRCCVFTSNQETVTGKMGQNEEKQKLLAFDEQLIRQ